MGTEKTNKGLMETTVFEKYESNVRSYCRKYPTVFTKAKGSILTDQTGKEYIDFLCGAGACNYGHNNDYIKSKVIEYLQSDGLIHGLDMYSAAKAEFIETLENKILIPRGFNYKILFPGPTGTNAVEAALKIARKVKGRSHMLALMGGFHGMSLGSLAVTTERVARDACGVHLSDVTHVPHPAIFKNFDTIDYIETILNNDHSGVDKPAGIIIESVQGEGGINVLPAQWLKDIRALCDRHDMLLIADEIQSGCGRCGAFFSFERAGIQPDIVVMAKSIGGIGLPAAITLVKPEYDVLQPGEHNGTFRGFQPSFIAGKAAIDYFVKEHIDEMAVRKGEIIAKFLSEHIPLINSEIECRGLGVMWGIDMRDYPLGTTQAIRKKCFENGLILELSGSEDTVIKIMPAITIDEETLVKGLEIVYKSVKEIIQTL